MSKTLSELQNEIGTWGDETFPKSNPATIAVHLMEEANELYSEWMSLPYGATTDHEEAADVFLLILNYAHRRGFDLAAAAERKMNINRARTWSTTPEPAGHFKHVEDQPDE